MKVHPIVHDAANIRLLNHYISAKLELQENSEAEKNPIILELYNLDQTYYFIQAYEKTAPVFVWAGYEIDRSSYLDHQIQELKNDLNLIQKYQDDLSIWAGGGITIASNCDAEYQECFDKVAAMLDLLNTWQKKV